jgi:hypothetical protein
MNATMTTLQITIGLTALTALVVLHRSEKGRAKRRSSGDGSWSGDRGYGGGDSGSDGGGGDGGGGGGGGDQP